MKCKNDGLSDKREKYDSLDEILSQKITLDTDIWDFLLIAGFDYWMNPTYQKASDETKNHIRARFKEIRSKHSRKEKGLESRFYKGIISEGGYDENRYATLRELKNMIGSRGLIFSQVGYKSFAHFNKTLQEFGIEPFKVGGRLPYKKL